MRNPPLLHALLAPAAIAAALALAGCYAERSPSSSSRHVQPLSEKMLTEIENKNMEPQSAILLRIFKEESELEVWKEDKTGRFALLRTYPICRWSGELGPKIKAGDRQAPEGFYTITPGLMNPNSSYHLAINTGFPNAYDRANGRSGAFLMIHGDCASAGCYAMTDEQIAEIYALARESFSGGQKSFQIQAFPFRMTPLNMATHRNSPHLAFWRMLKEGHDHFEVTRIPPKVDVCEKRYVFGVEMSGEVNATGPCPAHRVPGEIAAAVRDKQRRDDMQTAELIHRGAPVTPMTNGGQGGMNRTYLAAIARSGPGVTIRTAAGTIPSHVHPPAVTATENKITVAALEESRPAREPRASMQIASAVPAHSDEIGRFLSSRSSQPAEVAAPTPRPASQVVVSGALPPLSGPQTPAETKTTGALPSAASPAKHQKSPGAQSTPAGATRLLTGAQPALPSSGFDSRSATGR